MRNQAVSSMVGVNLPPKQTKICFHQNTRGRILNETKANCNTHDHKNVKRLYENILLKLSLTSYQYFTFCIKSFQISRIPLITFGR